MRALVVRGPKALTRPTDHPKGPVPLVSEVDEFMVTVASYDYNGSVKVVTSSTGSPPEGWRWVSLVELQDELSFEDAELIGEAVLCGG